MSNIVPNNNQGLSKSGDLESLLNTALQRPIKEKPYTARITRKAPTAFIFLLDQSGSMSENMSWKGQESTKAEVATMVINNILGQLLNRAADGGNTKNYYDICVIGYGGQSGKKANFCWEGSLSGQQWVDMEKIRASKEVEFEELLIKKSRTGTYVERKTRLGWIAECSNSLTPMKDAMEKACDLLQGWIATHSDYDGFPPTVINITDGEATDAEPVELIKLANKIKALHTTDGHVLFFNININNSSDDNILFPSSREELPGDEYAQALYDMSSNMPNAFKREIAVYKQIDMKKQYCAMAYNANGSQLIQFMNIGTSQTKNNQGRNA